MKTYTINCARIIRPGESFTQRGTRETYQVHCPIYGWAALESCGPTCPGFKRAEIAVDVSWPRFPRLREFVKELAEKIVRRIP
jgi:hypothetical protein